MAGMLRVWVVMLAACVLAAAAPPAIQHLQPGDEGAGDRSFSAYRAQIQTSIKQRNVQALLRLIASDIKLDFGGGEGLKEFKQRWKLADPNSLGWKALAMAVDNGGHFNSKTQFAAPYVYSAWPNDLDAFSYVVVMVQPAALRSKPNLAAPIMRMLDREFLEIVKPAGKLQHEATDSDWDEVKTLSGQRGFVQTKLVRSSIDYRAIFEKKKGRWSMTVFIAGD